MAEEDRVLLSARDLHIGFGGVKAADGISLDVMRGENLVIIGPNGAGKTTFLNISTGYLRPQSGHVLFKGRDITARPPRTITRLGVARAFQIPQLFLDHSVLENLLLARAARQGIWRPWSPLASGRPDPVVEDLTGLFDLSPWLHRPALELPEGARKLVDIAIALCLEPELLLMDEPTSGVASSEKFQVMDTLVNALRERGVSSVFVEHDMDVVERYADRVAVWSAGQIQALGPPAEVLSDPRVVNDVIGL